MECFSAIEDWIFDQILAYDVISSHSSEILDVNLDSVLIEFESPVDKKTWPDQTKSLK